jgi:hypothetical protein
MREGSNLEGKRRKRWIRGFSIILQTKSTGSMAGSEETVILVNGSSMCVSGFTGDSSPRFVTSFAFLSSFSGHRPLSFILDLSSTQLLTCCLSFLHSPYHLPFLLFALLRGVFPMIVGTPRHKPLFQGLGMKGFYVGDEASSKAGILNLLSPFTRSTITNWELMEQLWRHAFYNELRVAPEDHPVILTCRPDASKAEQQKIIQMMFETFDSPAMYLTSEEPLVLHASGLLFCGFLSLIACCFIC